MPPVSRPARVRRRHFFRQWRAYRDLTLETAAERIGVDPSTLQRIEVGISPYNQDTLEKLALAYGCEPIDLLSVNPSIGDPFEPLLNKVRAANSDVRRQLIAVMDALLKTSR